MRLRSKAHEADDTEAAVSAGPAGFISTLAAALGFGAPAAPVAEVRAGGVDFRDMWERFASAAEPEIPADDRELLDVLGAALGVAREEWGSSIHLATSKPDAATDLPTLDITVKHKSGTVQEARIFVCNRPTQGGGFKRQLDKVLAAMRGKACFLLRASEFPPNRKNQTAQAYRKFREAGGRSLMVPIPEWERMMMVREFHARHRRDAGFAAWMEQAKLLSGLVLMVHLLRPRSARPAVAGQAWQRCASTHRARGWS